MTTTGMLSATPKVAPWGLEAEPIKDQPALTAAEAKQIAAVFTRVATAMQPPQGDASG